jgi:hypothetical protein
VLQCSINGLLSERCKRQEEEKNEISHAEMYGEFDWSSLKYNVHNL